MLIRHISRTIGGLIGTLLCFTMACSRKSDTPAPSSAAALASAPAETPAASADTQSGVDWDSYRKQTEAVPRDTLAPSIYDGWKQFELNCSRCHGEFGVGTSFGPSLVVSLKNGGTVPDYATFLSVVCGGRKEKGMPAWCELGLEQNKIQEIYSYLKLRADGKVGAGRPARAEG